MPSTICVKCKGRLLCGRLKCPLVEKFKFLSKIEIGKVINDQTPPSIFIGRIGYPKISVGPLIAFNVDPIYADSPWLWENIEEVIRLRVSLVRTSRKLKVESPRNPCRFTQNIQELAGSTRPIDVEVRVNKIIKRSQFDDTFQPIGPTAFIDKMAITENPKIPNKVEEYYYDDAKSNEALFDLYGHGYSTYYLQRLFSAGMIGRIKNRKFVPTRWSITAVHSIIGEKLKEQIKEYDILDKYMLFTNEYFGNKFFILFIPASYSFYLVEIWRRGSVWSPNKDQICFDYESHWKKNDYSELGGGYYAARLPILEYQAKIKKQALVFMIREIKPLYFAPLGVWVVEEGVKRALKSKPETFNSLEEVIKSIGKEVDSRVIGYIQKINTQRNLSQFFD